MQTFTRMSGVAFLLIAARTAAAGPILLWSFDATGVALDTAGTEDGVMFGLELLPFDTPALSPFVLRSPFWRDGDHGTVDFTAETDPDFPGFATLATNEIEDNLRLWWLWEGQDCSFPCPGQGGGIGEPELFGDQLDLVRLTVHDLSIDPLVPRNQGSLSLDFNLTYEFFGAAVPEPGSALLLAFAIIGVGQARCRRRSGTI